MADGFDNSSLYAPPEALLEKDLRDYLATHLSEMFGENLELLGTEVPVDVGRIDLMVKDAAGTIWVIELKNRPCSREVVGQVLSYLGAVRKQFPKSDVRGVVVGPKFDATALSALEATSDLVFYEFRVRYSLIESARASNLKAIAAEARGQSLSRKPWLIDVSKQVMFRRANGREVIDLRAAHVIPGVGVAAPNLYVPFSDVELLGDGYAVGQFRREIVEGSVTLPPGKNGQTGRSPE